MIPGRGNQPQKPARAPRVSGDDPASSKLDQIRSGLSAIKSKRVTVTAEYIQIGAVGTVGAGIRATKQADGGVVDYFAHGYENHVAQIAPAGAMRIWAEPETGGEAYIPLTPSKRARSEDILASVARRFGGQYVKAFADGGIAARAFPGHSFPPVSGPVDNSRHVQNDFTINVHGASDAEIVTKIRGALTHFSHQIGSEVRA